MYHWQPKPPVMCRLCGREYNHITKRNYRHCDSCHKEFRLNKSVHNRSHYSNKERLRRLRYRKLVIGYYSKGTNACACCGETAFRFLTLDHLHGGGGRHRKQLTKNGNKHMATSMLIYRWVVVNGFPEGFSVLCYNCNITRGKFGECPHAVDRRLSMAEDVCLDSMPPLIEGVA